MARTMINGMMNGEGWQAMTMLDWEEGHTYEIAPGTNVHILPREFLWPSKQRLRANGSHRTETQRFITDRYDRFLFQVSRLQGGGSLGLRTKGDVRFPLNSYVEHRICRTQEAVSCVYRRELRR